MHGAAGERAKKHGCFFVYDERTKAHRIRFKLTMSTLSRECVMLKEGRMEYDINWDKESGNGCDLPDIWSVGFNVRKL